MTAKKTRAKKAKNPPGPKPKAPRPGHAPAHSERAQLAGVPVSEDPEFRAPTPAERVEFVLARVARGELVGRACRAEGIDRETLYRWRDASEENATRYTRVRIAQADSLAEEALEIADDSSGDEIIDMETGKVRLNTEFVARSKLRHEARRWYVAKVAPKLYGEKLQHEHEGAVRLLVDVETLIQ